MGINISAGYLPSFDIVGFPGYEIGGVRISIDGTVITRFEGYDSDSARYNAHGEPLDTPEEYVGEYLSLILQELTEAVIRFQRDEFERYEEIPAEIIEEPGFSRIVLSFCDGEYVRIAFQPKSACYSSYFPTEVTVGYAIDPDEMCHELVECYKDCVTFAENAHGDSQELQEELEEVHDWADEHIQELRAVTSKK